jgi:hypothetical protein
MSPLPSIAAPSATEKFTPSHALYSLQLLLERKPLMAMLRTRGHIVTTRDWIQAKTENLTYQLLNELEELKKSEKFSAYQLRRFRDPSRPKSTWDFVLDEAVWLLIF